MKVLTKLLPLILMAAMAVGTSTILTAKPSMDKKMYSESSAEKQEYSLYQERMDRGETLTLPEKLRFEELSERLDPSPARNPLDNQGGPDAFGYFYMDNVAPDTATFEWIELCGDPSATDGPQGDDASSVATWGWNFPFYGSNYASVYVSTNGLLQFNASNTTFTNLCPYATGTPTNPQIAPYWDDLYALTGGGCNGNGTAPWVRWRDFTDYFVVMWDIPHIGETGNSRFHFEAILYPSGRIKLQYDTLYTTTYPNSGSIGVDAPGAGNGLEYLTCNNNTLPSGTNDLAIWIYQDTGGGTITGTVTDANTADPIPGANVRIQQSGLNQLTNAQGQYTFTFVDPGTYTLIFSGSLYDSLTVPNVVVTEGQTTTVDAQLESAFVIYTYGGAPVPIADYDSSFAVITVPDDFVPTGAQVLINSITHTWDSDLSIWLRSPNGTTVDLSSNNGGSGDNYINTLFDDAAPTLISAGTAPFTGTFRPEGVLASVLGASALGDWTLVVYDGAGGDIGFINGWTLILGGTIGPQGTLAGVVRTLSNNQSLADAWVVAEGEDSTQTDAQGNYSLDLPATTYTVRFRHTGYCDSVRTNVLIEDGQTTILNMGLTAPIANISVSSITHQGVQGQITTTTFTIGNVGNCNLDYLITDDQDWLGESPTSGIVIPAGSHEITVYFDAQNLGAGDYNGTLTITHSATGSPVTIPVELIIPNAAGDAGETLPTEFALNGNYPNPFNAVTEIRYDLPQNARVSLVLYNMLGQEVRHLVNNDVPAGRHTAVWDGKNNNGGDMTSGIYLVRLVAGEHTFTGKVMLLK